MSLEPRQQYHKYRKQHRRASVMGFFGVTSLMTSSVLFFMNAAGHIGFLPPFLLAAVGLILCLLASVFYSISEAEFKEMTGMSPSKFRRELDREERRKRRL